MIPLPPSDQLSHPSGLSYVSSQHSQLLSEKTPTDISRQSSEKPSEKVSISVRQALNPQLAELGEPLMIEPEYEDLITEVPINFPTCQPTHTFSVNKEEGEKSPFWGTAARFIDLMRIAQKGFNRNYSGPLP
jgi:hypothetical protein